MNISFFSFVMSILWFNIFILIINFLRKNQNFITSFNTYSILFLAFLAIVRVIFSYDFKSSIIIESEIIFPRIYSFLTEYFYIGDFSINIFGILTTIWILGILFLTIKTIQSYFDFKKSIQNCTIIKNEDNNLILDKVLKKYNISKNVNIIELNEIDSPMVIGIKKATIYLPNIEFSETELEYIILHELNHFLGRDILKKIIVQSLTIVFWWNPLVYVFAKDFDFILEIQCDLRTTVNMAKPEKKTYLKNITTVLKNSISSVKPANLSYAPYLLNTSDISNIRERFNVVLNYQPRRLSNTINIAICTVFLILTVTSYGFIIQPVYYPEEEGIYFEDEGFIVKNNNFILSDKKLS